MAVLDFFRGLAANHLLLAAFTGWAVAQILKIIIHRILYKNWQVERLWGSGGMPSSHAATVCALTVAALRRFGPASAEFAISFVLAAVVLHDARGVRLETGKQARLLTAIRDLIDKSYAGQLPEVELKELVGHTPLQVAVGSALGIVIGFFLY